MADSDFVVDERCDIQCTELFFHNQRATGSTEQAVWTDVLDISRYSVSNTYWPHHVKLIHMIVLCVSLIRTRENAAWKSNCSSRSGKMQRSNPVLAADCS